MAEQDHVIELRGVTKTFEDTVALDSIDLTIRNGEFLTLLNDHIDYGSISMLSAWVGHMKPAP